LVRLLGAGAAGAGLAAAFPPVDLWWLAPFAVALLTLSLREVSRARPALGGAAVGGVFGLAFFALLTPWLRVIGPDAWLLITGLGALFLAVFGAGATRILPLPGWPLWLSCWWVCIEALRSRIPFGGFPWGRIGQSQADAPSAAWASIGGTPWLGFVVLLAGTLIAYALVAAAERRRLAPALAGAGAVALFALGALIPLPTDGAPVTVAVVQGNVPRTGMDAFGQREAVLSGHLEATAQLAEDVSAGDVPAPDLVVWPENASDIDPFQDPAVFDRISAAVEDVGVPILTGLVVEVDDGTGVANQGTVWDPVDGPQEAPAGTYVKQNLVPFGEYVPLRASLERFISRLDRIPRDFVAGTEPGVLKLGPVTVGDVICYDVAYDAAVRDAVAGGAELITVQTNNATYGRTGQVPQQWAISRLRAIEHGRTVLVAATSGISGIVAPDGSVVAETPEFTRQVIVESVTARTGLTWATRLSWWPELLLAGVGLGTFTWGWFAAARRRCKIES
jgi:apolipoprotein N-acyltransferase